MKTDTPPCLHAGIELRSNTLSVTPGLRLHADLEHGEEHGTYALVGLPAAHLVDFAEETDET
ncbi:hypothetical protein ACIBEA_42800 [Streptomyces sp. NPDC051555]|uniref:hypothetical protein n=1 Tax=Streptomyces sp. NPDC051555 TaxID=3365657 RepID=UPI003789CBCE